MPFDPSTASEFQSGFDPGSAQEVKDDPWAVSKKPFVDNLKDTANYFYHNGYGSLAQVANGAGFGIPQAALNAVSPQAADAVFPKPVDGAGEVVQTIAGFGGGGGSIKGAAGAVGQIMERGAVKNAAREAAVFTTARQAVKDKLKDVGQAVSDFYKGPAGDVPVIHKDVANVLNRMPKGARDSFIERNSSGLLDADGNPIFNVRNLQKMRDDIGRGIKDGSYTTPGGTTQSDAITMERELKDIIRRTLPDEHLQQLSKVDKDYGKFDRTAAEFLRATTNREGNVVSKPLERTMKANDPNITSRLNDLKDQVPEVGAAMNNIKNAARAEKVKKLLQYVEKFGSGGAAIGAGMKLFQ